jgi:hypothetical protein
MMATYSRFLGALVYMVLFVALMSAIAVLYMRQYQPDTYEDLLKKGTAYYEELHKTGAVYYEQVRTHPRPRKRQ